ncbi:MAG: hypothetical protein MZW92_58725 [Comamonadaceae bacterium]|nr:hypothetical protein [Comamonadaceae bacterium]
MLAAERPDVFWATNGLLPVWRPRGLATVVTVHDLVYRFAPETLPLVSLWGRRVGQRMAVRAADELVYVSQATATDATAATAAEADAIIQPLADESFRRPAIDAVRALRQRLNLPETYLLTLGTLEPRKNIVALVDAYLNRREAGVALPLLAIAGGKGCAGQRHRGAPGPRRGTGLRPPPGLRRPRRPAGPVRRLRGLRDALAVRRLRHAAARGPALRRRRRPRAARLDARGRGPVGRHRAGRPRRHRDHAGPAGARRTAPVLPGARRHQERRQDSAARLWSLLMQACRAPATPPAAKSLLVLTPRFPYPVVGGDRLRIYQLCRELAAHYRLTRLSVRVAPRDAHGAARRPGVQPRRTGAAPRWTSWLNSALALPTRTPLQVAYFRSHEFRRRAAALMPEHDATLAHPDPRRRHHQGPARRQVPGDDRRHLAELRARTPDARRGARLPGARLRARGRRLKDYERTIVDRFDHSFLVSEVDRAHLFQERPDRLARVSVVSNGVDLRHLPFRARNAGDEIVFIGNLNSMQNFDAAMYMAREILPLVMQAPRRPVARDRPHPDGQGAALPAPLPGVDVTGEVPDVAEAAASGAVGVHLRLGARRCRTRCSSTWRSGRRRFQRRWGSRVSRPNRAAIC